MSTFTYFLTLCININIKMVLCHDCVTVEYYIKIIFKFHNYSNYYIIEFKILELTFSIHTVVIVIKFLPENVIYNGTCI